METLDIGNRILKDLRHLRNLMAFLPDSGDLAKTAEALLSYEKKLESLSQTDSQDPTAKQRLLEASNELALIEKEIPQELVFNPKGEIGTISSLSEFLGKYPMQFVVRSIDIGRILWLAKVLHAKNEESPNRPIKIAVIGSNSLALSILMQKMASENGLPLELSFDVPSLASRYGKDPIILGLTEKRKELSGKQTANLSKHYAEISEEIETRLASIPCGFDLIIDAWMEPGVDRSEMAREANAAGIVYILERNGATGARSDAPFPEPPAGLYAESFNPGKNYRTIAGWLGHSTSQLKDMSQTQPDDFTEYKNSWNPPFSNAFVMQVRKGLEPEIIKMDQSIDLRFSPYPWEAELEGKGGPSSPVISLRDSDGKLYYFVDFENLALKLKKHTQ